MHFVSDCTNLVRDGHNLRGRDVSAEGYLPERIAFSVKPFGLSLLTETVCGPARQPWRQLKLSRYIHCNERTVRYKAYLLAQWSGGCACCKTQDRGRWTLLGADQSGTLFTLQPRSKSSRQRNREFESSTLPDRISSPMMTMAALFVNPDILACK